MLAFLALSHVFVGQFVVKALPQNFLPTPGKPCWFQAGLSNSRQANSRQALPFPNELSPRMAILIMA